MTTKESGLSQRPLGQEDHGGRDRAITKKQVASRLELPRSLTVGRLADLLHTSSIEVIKQLMRRDIMAGINQSLDYNTAALIASDFGFEAVEAPSASQEAAIKPKASRGPWLEEDDSAEQQPRSPVVTIMGHVDHGKTLLLDAIRKTNVVATEAGGITQRIGAYQVEVNGQKITFLDTPGHEAFTAMRARGAQVTDIAVLVVAADDGVMPQTEEAISHARAAGVPIVVAMNKVDKPSANVERVKQQLADRGLVCEEWGGDTVCVPVSAKTKQGISDLLENLLIVAELEELKANPHRPAAGTIIDAELDKNRGPVATVLIQAGTLKQGDTVVVGDSWGKLKAMFNDSGKQIKRAGPSIPVAVLGLNKVPRAGDTLQAVTNEREARAQAESSQRAQQAEVARGVSLDQLLSQTRDGQVKELNMVLKTDVEGSIDPIKKSLERLETGRLKPRIIHAASGAISENDVMLALASKGIVVGFNTRHDAGARRLADLEKVGIRLYNVIYELVDNIGKALTGMIQPTYVEAVEGRAEVRAAFSSGKRSKVAGVYITEGKILMNSLARVMRKGQVVHQSRVISLRRYREDIKEMSFGTEAGVGIEGFNDFETGDIIETYRRERSTAA